MSTITLKSPPVLADHHLGNINASIMIVEYGDFQSPQSAVAMKVMDQILKEYKDVCFVFRHFPLTSEHHHAGFAAVAAEAAGNQGKFWAMYHAIFAHQDQLDSEGIFSRAREIKLDMRKFLNDLEDETLLKRVNEDFKSGIESEVEHTPSIFINGIRYEGDLTVRGLREEIDEILSDKEAHP